MKETFFMEWRRFLNHISGLLCTNFATSHRQNDSSAGAIVTTPAKLQILATKHMQSICLKPRVYTVVIASLSQNATFFMFALLEKKQASTFFLFLDMFLSIYW